MPQKTPFGVFFVYAIKYLLWLWKQEFYLKISIRKKTTIPSELIIVVHMRALERDAPLIFLIVSFLEKYQPRRRNKIKITNPWTSQWCLIPKIEIFFIKANNGGYISLAIVNIVLRIITITDATPNPAVILSSSGLVCIIVDIFSLIYISNNYWETTPLPSRLILTAKEITAPAPSSINDPRMIIVVIAKTSVRADLFSIRLFFMETIGKSRDKIRIIKNTCSFDSMSKLWANDHGPFSMRALSAA